MDINKPLNRRKALKIIGLGALGTCIPQLPAIAKDRKEGKERREDQEDDFLLFSHRKQSLCISSASW